MAVVVEMMISADGSLQTSEIYRARVRNHAQLAYNSVAAWLDGGSAPEAITTVKGLAENLHLQNKAAQRMRNFRRVNGALSLETIEAKPIFDGDQIRDLEVEHKNRATDIIEDCMIAANGVTARYLTSKKFPSIRRVVRTPKRWDRIIEARRRNTSLSRPPNPIQKRWMSFSSKRKPKMHCASPISSLAVIRQLLGAGEYVAELPDGTAPGTLWSRRQRLCPFHCPESSLSRSDHAAFIEGCFSGQCLAVSQKSNWMSWRNTAPKKKMLPTKLNGRSAKSAAALLLEERIGERFDAIVTGASDKGTWARLLDIPVEGKVVQGFEGLDVGDQVRVQSTSSMLSAASSISRKWVHQYVEASQHEHTTGEY